MRQIASLVLAALLVAGTVPAVGAAGVAQHGTDAQLTTDLGGLDVAAGELRADAGDGVTVGDADSTLENHTGARVTDYEIADRTLAGDEPLVLRMNGSGEGSVPVVLALDGERWELGTLTADGERVAFEPAGSGAAAMDVDVTCEFGYNDEDGWYLHCEITFSTASLADGVHDVGVNGLEATPVAVGEELAVTDFETVATANDTATVDVRGAGVGETPLTLSLDGERHRLGTLRAGPDGARLDDSTAEPLPIDIDVDCEGGYNSEDGWYVRCKIEVDLFGLADGSGDDASVGVNDLPATTVDLGTADGNLAVTDYEVADRTIDPAESLRLTARGAGESAGSAPLSMTLDGERTRLGTVHVAEDGATFEPDDDLAAQSIDVSIHCEGGYNSEDGWWFECTIEIELSSIGGGGDDGSHDVGVGGLEPTAVAVGEELELTGYEIAGTNSPVNETETPPSAVTVYRNNTVRNNTATLAVTGAGVGETSLSLSLDGERHRLGTVRVDAEGADFVPDDDLDAQPIDVEVECEAGYNSDDGWYVRCKIEVDLFSILDGDDGSDIGVNDLAPTRVDVEPYEAQLAGYEFENRTVAVGETLRLTTTFEGKSGDVPLVVTVDGQEYRAGTVHIEDGRVASVETADAAASPIGFVPCPDLQDDNPLIIVWCATDVPSVAQGSHAVGVNGMEPVEVTVESGGPGFVGGLVGGVADFLGDLLGALGGLLSVPAGPE